MRPVTRPGIVLFALGLGLVPAAASADDPPKPPPVWSGKAEASYVATSGQLGREDARRRRGGRLRARRLELQALARVHPQRVGRRRDGTLVRRSSCAPRASSRPGSRSTARAPTARTRFAGIDHQWAGEAGAAYQFLSGDPHSLKVEAGLGYDERERGSPRSAGRGELTETASFTTARVGLEYKWKFSKTGEFSEEASFTEDLKDSKDWRFADKVSLAAGLTTVLSVKLSYAWLTLNEPVPGKKKTDTITSAALVAKF